MQGTRSSSQIYLLSLVLDVVILTAHFLRISITYLNNQNHSEKWIENKFRALNWLKIETLEKKYLCRHLGHVLVEPVINSD